MLSLAFRHRSLPSCPRAAALIPCRRLSSSHQRRAYDANIAHHKNTRLYGKAAQNPSGEATQWRPGHDFLPRSESLGQKVVLDSCDGVVLKDVGGKEFLDAMTGSPLAQPEITHEDLARVSVQQVKSNLGVLSLLLSYWKMLKLGVSLDQRNLTNSSARKLCKRLSEIAAQVFPDKMAESRVFLTTGQDASIEAAYHLALRFWNRSGVLGTKFLGGYNKQKIITFRNCYH
jgi:4-aminobutyrate aminotransferase-like enzyme